MQNWSTLLGEVEDQWGTRKGLLLVLLLLWSFFLWLFTSSDIQKISVGELLVAIAATVAVITLWMLTRMPRVPRKKVGFAVAIMYEDSPTGPQVRSDFVAKLRELIQSSQELRHKFHFVELNQRLSKRLVEAENRERLAAKMNCHFMIFGRAKSRVLFGGPSHVIELQGLVRHAPIETDRGRQFGEDVSQVMPQKVVVKDPDSLLLFEFAARHIDIVGRYVIGVAALLSGDLGYAEQLLLDSRARLNAIGSGPHVATLRSKIAARLGEVYSHLLARAQAKYVWKRDIEALRESESLLKRRRAVVGDDYHARLSAAICAFMLHRDVATARSEFAACSRIDDASWRYGQAFLAAYEGDLHRAYREYRDAFAAPLSDVSVPVQCEEFILIVLELEPQRYFLHFALGLINLKAKGDYAAARRDLTSFLAKADANRFPVQVEAAKRWIMELDGYAQAS